MFVCVFDYIAYKRWAILQGRPYS